MCGVKIFSEEQLKQMGIIYNVKINVYKNKTLERGNTKNEKIFSADCDNFISISINVIDSAFKDKCCNIIQLW